MACGVKQRIVAAKQFASVGGVVDAETCWYSETDGYMRTPRSCARAWGTALADNAASANAERTSPADRRTLIAGMPEPPGRKALVALMARNVTARQPS
jgi:hypothetical protein